MSPLVGLGRVGNGRRPRHPPSGIVFSPVGATDSAAGGGGAGVSSRGWKVAILVLGTASLVTSIDLTIISVALPTIEGNLRDLGIGGTYTFGTTAVAVGWPARSRRTPGDDEAR